MLNTNPTVSLGDLVIVYEDYKTMKHVYVKSGGVYHNNFGSFKHDDMVGRPFGHKMASHNGHGFVHLLQPTAELWTASLSHRTQVRPALTVALTLTPTLALTLTLALAFTLTLALALALTLTSTLTLTTGRIRGAPKLGAQAAAAAAAGL